MRFASFRSSSGTPTWGVEHGGLLYDLGRTGARMATSLREAMTVGITERLAPGDLAEPCSPVEDATFLPVIPDPGKVVCIGVNYRTHRDESGHIEEPRAPTVFLRFADTLIGHRAPAIKPDSTSQFDYEGELAVVIARPASRVPADRASDVIGGYAAFNDFSVRDWQRAAPQWTPGKNFAGTGAFGPYLLPLKDVPDTDALTLETRVNGQTRQSASVADLVFRIPQLIEYVTAFTALSPGDVIVTGTPGGVGLFMDPPTFLVEGDDVEVEITGLGVLRNTVAKEA